MTVKINHDIHILKTFHLFVVNFVILINPEEWQRAKAETKANQLVIIKYFDMFEVDTSFSVCTIPSRSHWSFKKVDVHTKWFPLYRLTKNPNEQRDHQPPPAGGREERRPEWMSQSLSQSESESLSSLTLWSLLVSIMFKFLSIQKITVYNF